MVLAGRRRDTGNVTASTRLATLRLATAAQRDMACPVEAAAGDPATGSQKPDKTKRGGRRPVPSSMRRVICGS
jgi:hypothetical protein